MASASGTEILQDDGSVTLDESGAELISAGDSDCDCCAPNCCNVYGYCFDLNHIHFRGHISLVVKVWVSAHDCPGTTPDHTVIFAADYDLPISGCVKSEYWDSQPPPVGTGPGFLWNVTCTVDGVPEAYDGTGAYAISFRNFKFRLDSSTLWSLEGVLAMSGGWLGSSEIASYVSAGSGITGDALGFGTQTYSECDNRGSGSFSSDSTIDMTPQDNYCCCVDGYDCVTRTTPLVKGDGTC